LTLSTNFSNGRSYGECLKLLLAAGVDTLGTIDGYPVSWYYLGQPELLNLLKKAKSPIAVEIPVRVPGRDDNSNPINLPAYVLQMSMAQDMTGKGPFFPRRFPAETISFMIGEIPEIDMNLSGDLKTPYYTLYGAAASGDPQVVQAALARKPNISAISMPIIRQGRGEGAVLKPTARTALSAAVIADNLDIVKLLLDAGANPNQKFTDNEAEYSPLAWAQREGLKCAFILKSRGGKE
jgi:hypothetical protein